MKPGLAEFTAEMFQPHVGTNFTFHGIRPDGIVEPTGAELELLEVKGQKGGLLNRPPEWRMPFSVLFALREGAVSTNGLCRMVHDSLEPSDLLLSRVTVPGSAPGSTEKYYEAVFG